MFSLVLRIMTKSADSFMVVVAFRLSLKALRKNCFFKDLKKDDMFLRDRRHVSVSWPSQKMDFAKFFQVYFFAKIAVKIILTLVALVLPSELSLIKIFFP